MARRDDERMNRLKETVVLGDELAIACHNFFAELENPVMDVNMRVQRRSELKRALTAYETFRPGLTS